MEGFLILNDFRELSICGPCVPCIIIKMEGREGEMGVGGGGISPTISLYVSLLSYKYSESY